MSLNGQERKKIIEAWIDENQNPITSGIVFSHGPLTERDIIDHVESRGGKIERGSISLTRNPFMSGMYFFRVTPMPRKEVKDVVDEVNV